MKEFLRSIATMLGIGGGVGRIDRVTSAIHSQMEELEKGIDEVNNTIAHNNVLIIKKKEETDQFVKNKTKVNSQLDEKMVAANNLRSNFFKLVNGVI